MKSISVLMSVYKNETPERMERCMKSIWDNQTRKPDQIVLIEDGPLTEGLYQVLDNWSKKLGAVLVRSANPTNMGLTASLNRGLKLVTSDYMARMDSDDRSAPNRFELQGSFLDSHPEVYVLGGTIQEFDDDNECLSVRYYPKDNIKSYIVKGAPVCHATSMMRMEMFREGGISYNERYRKGQDSALWFDVLKAGYVITNISDITYYVYCDKGMMQRRSGNAGKEFELFVKGIYGLYGPFSWRYIYPIGRYIMRKMPVGVIKAIYGSKLRSKIMK